jgi:hypothetical protein
VIDLLSQILCWIKQVGAMVLSALVAFVNLLLTAVVGLANAAIAAWPIETPDLPSTPDVLVTAVAWLKWTPIPFAAVFAIFAFWILVEGGWLVIRPILRWAKVGE